MYQYHFFRILSQNIRVGCDKSYLFKKKKKDIGIILRKFKPNYSLV